MTEPLTRYGLFNATLGRWAVVGVSELPRIFFFEYEAKAAERDYPPNSGWKAQRYPN